MALAGLSWGVYSLRGRGVANALVATSGNFLRSIPLAVVVWLVCWESARWSITGVLCAIASGALASGLGYACWYAVVGSISRTTAAIIQLTVPVLAALGGVLLLHETASSRLMMAGLVVLAGIACLTLPQRGKTR